MAEQRPHQERESTAGIVTAEPQLRQVEEPPVLFTLKRQRRPENWEFISLVAKHEYHGEPVEALTSAHASGAYCHKCKIIIAFSKSQTSSVATHVRVYHPGHLVDYPKRKKARAQAPAPLRNEFATAPSTISDGDHWSPTVEQRAHFKMLLAKWCAESNRPLSILDDDGLNDAVAYVTEGICGLKISLPSRASVATEVRVLASQLRASLKKRFSSDATFFSATTDIWSDRAMRSYLAFTVHYLDKNFVLHDWTLEVEELPGKHTGQHISDAIDRIHWRWHINPANCVRIVRDGASNAIAAMEMLGADSFQCVAHALHLVVSGALIKKRGKATDASPATRTSSADESSSGISPQDDQVPDAAAAATAMASETPSAGALVEDDVTPALLHELQERACEETEDHVETHLDNETLKSALASMRDIVQVFRALAIYFRNSPKAKSCLVEIRNEVQKDTRALFSLDCPTRWSSTWEMLSHFVELELTVNTFFAFLATRKGKREFAGVKLIPPTPAQWFAARLLLRLLGPFAVAVEHLSGSHYPTLSVTMPILRYIKSQLKRTDLFDEDARLLNDPQLTDPVKTLMDNVRSALRRLFRERFHEQDPLMLWVSYLDPRLTDMDHLDEAEKAFARSVFLDEAIAIERLVPTIQQQSRSSAHSAATLTTPVKQSAMLKSAVFGRRVQEPLVVAQPSLSPIERCDLAINKYLAATALVDADTDPLAWWQHHHKEHPVIAMLALKYLSCVATSVPSERAFSTGGNIVTAKRCSLAPSSVRDMVFLSQNSKGRA